VTIIWVTMLRSRGWRTATARQFGSDRALDQICASIHHPLTVATQIATLDQIGADALELSSTGITNIRPPSAVSPPVWLSIARKFSSDYGAYCGVSATNRIAGGGSLERAGRPPSWAFLIR
jgi:hypothetical protein